MQNRMQFSDSRKVERNVSAGGNDCEDAGLLFLESKAKRCKKIMLGTLQIKFYSVIIRK